ncbi:MAG: hypothetical protein ACLP22_09900, partial [Solirubrobacteraceae bacterium]
KTTLEIYAHVQKRLSRPQVKRAFEALLAETDLSDLGIPAEAREKMCRKTSGSAQKRSRGTAQVAGGPQKWAPNANPPRMTSNSLITRKQARISRAFLNGHGWA